MKKLFILLGIFLMMLTSISAQEKTNNNKKQINDEYKQDLKKELDLTEDQKSKMKSIHEKYKVEMNQLKTNDHITRGEFKKQMSSLNESRKTEIDAVLTAEQKNKMKELKVKQQEEMKLKSEERFEKMSNKLELDEKQKATLKEQQLKTQAQIKAIRESKTLTDIQKKEQIKTLRDQQKENTKTILTDEQKQKIASHKKGGKK